MALPTAEVYSLSGHAIDSAVNHSYNISFSIIFIQELVQEREILYSSYLDLWELLLVFFNFLEGYLDGKRPVSSDSLLYRSSLQSCFYLTSSWISIRITCLLSQLDA